MDEKIDSAVRALRRGHSGGCGCPWREPGDDARTDDTHPGAIAHAFTAPHRPGHTALAIAPPDTFRYWAVRRRTPGAVEVHRDWVDVTYVRAGSARLETGTTVRGDWKTGRGEWRGGRILHPRVHIMRAGDMVVIPAGLAHRFVPRKGKAFEYITIKVPAAG